MKRRTQSVVAMAIIGVGFSGMSSATASQRSHVDREDSPAAHHTIREFHHAEVKMAPAFTRIAQSHAALNLPHKVIVITPPAAKVVRAPEMNAASAAGGLTLLLGFVAVLLGRRAKPSNVATTSMIAA